MTDGHRKNHFIAAAVIWHGDEILLVEQQGPGDTVSAWAEAAAGSTWFYRRQPDDHDQLLFVSGFR